jgi:uncharacterized protein
MQNTNSIGWFDIYVSDLKRATKFYESVFGVTLQNISDPTSETKMMSFPSDMSVYGSGGALVLSPFSKPGVGGTLIYFNSEDCVSHEAKITSLGGKVLRPKFSIGEFGFVSICEDTEGNQIGLSSTK